MKNTLLKFLSIIYLYGLILVLQPYGLQAQSENEEVAALNSKQVWNKQAVNLSWGFGFTPKATSVVLNFGMMKPITDRIRATAFFDLYLSTKLYDNERTMWQCGLHVNGQYLVLPAKVIKIYLLGGVSLNQITTIHTSTLYNPNPFGSSTITQTTEPASTKLGFDIGAGFEFPETVGLEVRYATHIDALSFNIVLR